MAPGYGCVPRAEWRSRFSFTVVPKRTHFWHKGDDVLWWLGKTSTSATADGVYLVRFSMTRDRSRFFLLRRATRLRQELGTRFWVSTNTRS